MRKRTLLASCAMCAVLALTATAPAAFAAEDARPNAGSPSPIAKSLAEIRMSEQTLALSPTGHETPPSAQEVLDSVAAQAKAANEEKIAREASDKLLECDPSLLEAVGTQEATGHTTCCAAFACAYGDAYVKGTAQGHAAYGCACCTWPGWGGGDSSFRNLGSAQALLSESYEQIKAGKPTVVHVAASYGEHWVTLVGYQNVDDPASLTLDNFICLDPWDGAQVTASERFSLYGDNCQHVSDV